MSDLSRLEVPPLPLHPVQSLSRVEHALPILEVPKTAVDDRLGRLSAWPNSREHEGTDSELGAAAGRLRARLSAGLPMEQAMLVTEDMDPADKRAVELWFGMDY